MYLSFADASYLTLGGVLSDGEQRFLEWESADWDSPKTLLLQTFADNFFADVVRACDAPAGSLSGFAVRARVRVTVRVAVRVRVTVREAVSCMIERLSFQRP